MSDPIVVGFDNELKADEVLHDLGELQKEHLVDLDFEGSFRKSQGRSIVYSLFSIVQRSQKTVECIFQLACRQQGKNNGCFRTPQ